MTYGPPPGWAPPPPPPPPPNRFAGKWIWLGAGAGIVATLVLPLAGNIVGRATRLDPLGGILLMVGFLAPLVTGIVLTARQGSPSRRGFGLGLIIGWAVAPIVFAGVCIVILVAAYSQTGS